ncbi:MAG: hypothetical protein GY886_12845 [Gammaproteobacteria bacterium]|nr:hypothetical protein [Gammaproteobacteria bacterium]
MENKPSKLKELNRAHVYSITGECTPVSFNNIQRKYLDRFSEICWRKYDRIQEELGDLFKVEDTFFLDFGVVASEHSEEEFDACYKLFANHLGTEEEELLIVELHNDL